MKAVVGFDRKLKRDWLDALADQVAKGEDMQTLRTFLHERLKSDGCNLYFALGCAV